MFDHESAWRIISRRSPCGSRSHSISGRYRSKQVNETGRLRETNFVQNARNTHTEIPCFAFAVLSRFRFRTQQSNSGLVCLGRHNRKFKTFTQYPRQRACFTLTSCTVVVSVRRRALSVPFLHAEPEYVVYNKSEPRRGHSVIYARNDSFQRRSEIDWWTGVRVAAFPRARSKLGLVRLFSRSPGARTRQAASRNAPGPCNATLRMLGQFIRSAGGGPHFAIARTCYQ